MSSIGDETLSLQELLDFLDARDKFLGNGNHHRGQQDLAEGFRRLLSSRHPEARYVCSLFPEGPPKDVLEARSVFELQGEHPVALCYAGAVGKYKEDVVRTAAELGHPYAMGLMSVGTWTTSSEDRLRWAKRASEAGDRIGWSVMGHCLWHGDGCEKDRARALSWFERAARLGDGYGMRRFGEEFKDDDPERYLWLGRYGRAAGDWELLVQETKEHLRLHDEGRGHCGVLMMIGRMLKGREDSVREHNRASAERAVRMYEQCLERAMEGVLCWMLCARRLGLYRDVALMVGRRVWEERDAFFERAAKQK